MAVYTPQQFDEDGLQPTMTAVGASNSFANRGIEFILIENDHVATVTVTIAPAVTSFTHPTYGNAEKASRTEVITAGARCLIGPFKPGAFNTDGDVTFTFDITTATTAAVLYI